MKTLQDQFHACLYFSSSALARVLDRSAKELFGAVELSPTQGYILMAARKASGITVGDLAHVLVLDQSTVTKTLEKMELKGLVQREVFGRSVRIFLTQAGERREADAKAAWKKLRTIYEPLVGQADVVALTEALEKAKRQLLV